MNSDNKWMELAIKEAKKAENIGEVPVGAVLIKNNEIISNSHNLVITQNDPTAHAEIVAIRSAGKTLENYRIVDSTLYVTLEPCAMCSSAISLARIKRLFFGAYDHKTGAVESGIKYFQTPSCNHKPEFYGGFKEKDSESILNSYFKMKRV